MATLSVYTGKISCYLAATLAAYTLALLYVSLSLDYGRHKRQISLQPSSTPCPLNMNLIPTASNSSKLPVSEVPVWKFPVISPIQSSLHTNSPGKLTLKLNVKHTPSKDNVHYIQNNRRYDKATYFREKLNGTEFRLARQTIEIFDFVMTKNKLDYMIYGGTLIGSYRHHGLVPWDDDLDVLVPLSAQSSLYAVFDHFSKEYRLNTDWTYCWKLFSNKADPIRGYNWMWPYLDIFFYADNETHIWDVAPHYTKNFVYLKSDIFPLRRRPFMNLLLLAPYNARSVIETNYDISLCKSGKWIHKWERYGVETSLPCSLLYFKFPFVKRTLEHAGCNESLIQNGEIISHFVNIGMPC